MRQKKQNSQTWISRTIAATIAATVVLQPVMTSATLANSGANSSAGPILNISFDLPEGGQLDMYHSVTTHRSNVANAMYVLRNTAVEDLLNTRRGLKVLLGGTSRARSVSANPQLTFAAPQGVIDLFMLGGLGREYSDTNSAPLVQSHGIDEDGVPGIAGPVNWLSSKELVFDPAMRRQVVQGLAYVSAQITKIDQALKFFQEDFWKDRQIADEFFYQQSEKLAKEAEEKGKPAPLLILTDHLKKQWLEEHKMTDALAALAGHREYLLDRYHLLAIKVNKVSLYQHIYDSMEHIGFPDNSMEQRSPVQHLPAGTDPIPFPVEFESRADHWLDVMAQADHAQMIDELVLAVDGKLDQALLVSLANNTEKLEELTRDTDFEGADSPMVELAKYDDLWEVAQKRYGYLAGMIDFDDARDKVRTYFKNVEETQAKIRYTAYGVGIGVGVIGTVATLGMGAEAMVLGLSAKQILFGAGLLTTAQASLDYVDSKKAATLARGLYLGSAKMGSFKEMQETQLINDESYQYLIGNLVMLGCQLPLVSMLSKGRTIYQNGKSAFVALTEPEIKMLKEAVAKIAPRAQALAPLGKAMLATTRNLLGQQAVVNEYVTLRVAINRVAESLKTTPAKIHEILKKVPLVSRLANGWEERVLVDPNFLMNMVREQRVSFAVGMIAEYAARGDNMYDERFYVGLDMFTGAALTAGLVWWEAKTLATVNLTAPRHMFQKGLTAAQRATIFGQRFKNNFLMGWGVHLPTDLAVNTYQHIKNPGEKTLEDRAKQIAKSSLLSSFLLGVSSNIRFQASSAFADSILERMKQGAINPDRAKFILEAASGANNLFGNYSYVLAAKATGVQIEAQTLESTDPEMDLYERELANDPVAQKAGFKPIGGAFVKIEQEDEGAGYLLDFLRNGQAESPASAASSTQ